MLYLHFYQAQPNYFDLKKWNLADSLFKNKEYTFFLSEAPVIVKDLAINLKLFRYI